MAVRRPLITSGGRVRELPQGDSIDAGVVVIVATQTAFAALVSGLSLTPGVFYSVTENGSVYLGIGAGTYTVVREFGNGVGNTFVMSLATLTSQAGSGLLLPGYQIYTPDTNELYLATTDSTFSLVPFSGKATQLGMVPNSPGSSNNFVENGLASDPWGRVVYFSQQAFGYLPVSPWTRRYTLEQATVVYNEARFLIPITEVNAPEWSQCNDYTSVNTIVELRPDSYNDLDDLTDYAATAEYRLRRDADGFETQDRELEIVITRPGPIVGYFKAAVTTFFPS